MNQESMLRPALIGGVVLGLLSAIPLVSLMNCFCCAWVIGGGILAANLYVKGSHTAVSLGQGVILGLLTGAIGAGVDILFSLPLQFLLRGMGANYAGQIKEMLDRMAGLPPETKEALDSILLGSGQVNLFLFAAGAFFTLIIYCIMAMIGGTIGVAIFEKRKTGSPPPEAPYRPAAEPPLPPADRPPSDGTWPEK